MERGNLYSNLEEQLIFIPGDLESVPPPELHPPAGAGVQRKVLQDLRDAAHSFFQGSVKFVDVWPFSGARPLFAAFSMAAELQGVSAEESNLRTNRRGEAQKVCSGDAQAFAGGPSTRM